MRATSPLKKERKLNRLYGYDYSGPGYYFVTICTKERECFFGKAAGSETVTLNKWGKIAHQFWSEIPQHYPNVELDEFVIMPNHVHGIIFITDSPVGTEQCSVPTRAKKNYGLISKIIKSYKNAVTNIIRQESELVHFAWQRSFYDHIIRNDSTLNNIREYIQNNPRNWHKDEDNPINVKHPQGQNSVLSLQKKTKK